MNRRNFLGAGLAGAALSAVAPSRILAAGTVKAGDVAGEPPFRPRADITPYVADFIAGAQFKDLPPDVLALGQKSILDGIGLTLVGAKSHGSKILLRYFQDLGYAKPVARVLGTDQRLPARFAAFANATSSHMEDFDDTQLGAVVHPTTPVLPGLFAAADQTKVNGRDFVLAYHIGVEVECKIGEACSPRANKSGFHPTGVFGVFGSAAAGAKLRGYDREKIQNALAVAASQASGLSQNFGTLTKPFHAGHAAEAGIVALDLAGRGWNGAEAILEAQNGFFHAYGGTYDPAVILGRLGKPWTFNSPGVAIKPYPSGALTHPGMTELTRLIRANRIKAADVARVDVGTNSQAPKSLHNHRPQTALEAKFSMEFCLASLLVFGKAGLAEFTDQVVSSPEVQAMIAKIHYGVDPVAEADGYAKITTTLKITLNDGRTISSVAKFAKGSPDNPLSYDEVAEKFLGCTAFAGWDPKKAEAIIGLVRNIEDMPDVSVLTDLCVL